MKIYLKIDFLLICFQQLFLTNVATLQCFSKKQQLHQRFTFPGPLVLRSDSFNFQCLWQIGTKLFYNVLNPTHVPLSSANNRTLGILFNSRMRWVDIEVPNDSVNKSSWESSACYPRRTFYPLSDEPFTQIHRITMTDKIVLVRYVYLTIK